MMAARLVEDVVELEDIEDIEENEDAGGMVDEPASEARIPDELTFNAVVLEKGMVVGTDWNADAVEAEVLEFEGPVICENNDDVVTEAVEPAGEP